MSDSATPWTVAPPGFSVHEILQARLLELVAILYPAYLPDPGMEPLCPALAGRFFTTETLLKACLFL